MKVRKALITSAGKEKHNLPLQRLVDRDGKEKSILSIFIEDILKAGIEEIGIVIMPGDESSYLLEAKEHKSKIEFIFQNENLGYAHAIYCAKDFIADDPFLHLVGDHLNVSRIEERCTEKVVKLAELEKCSVSAVKATHESQLLYFGAIGGKRLQGTSDLYKIENVIEKPTPTEAEQKLIIPGLRSSYYLCFFGIHVITPSIFKILDQEFNIDKNPEEVVFSNALRELSKVEQYIAVEDDGWRYNLGEKYGLLKAQLALALSGVDKNTVLANLLEVLALHELDLKKT